MAMNVLANDGGGITPPTDNLANLTEKQVHSLSRRILTRSLEKVKDLFTTSVEDGDSKHVPTGQAVYDAIRNEVTKISAELSAQANDYTDERINYISNIVNAINNWRYETIDGDLPRNPDPTTIYLQRDDEEDKTYVMYVFSKGRWIVIGDTSIDLVNFWKKDDIESLANALISSPEFLSSLFTAGDEKDIELKVDPGSTVVATLPDGTLVSTTADSSGNAVLTLPTNTSVILNYKADGAIKTERLDVTDGNSEYQLTVDPDTRVTASLPDGTIVTGVSDSKGKVTLDFPKDGEWTVTSTENGIDATHRVVVVDTGTPTNFDSRYAKKEAVDQILKAVENNENYLDRTKKETYVDFFGLLMNHNGVALGSTGLSAQDAEDIKDSAKEAIRDLGFMKTEDLADYLAIKTSTPAVLTRALVQAAIVKTVNESGVVANLTTDDINELRSRLDLSDLGDTYLTVSDFRNVMGISSITPIDSKSFATALMNIINQNSDKITNISDSRFNELIKAKFAAI